MLKKIKNYIPIIIMMLIAIVVGVLFLTDTLDFKSTVAAVSENKPLALTVIIALFLLKGCALIVPFAAVLICSALVFDIQTAVIVNTVGTAICISLSYFIGRFSKELTFEKVINKYPKFKKYFENASDYSFTFCFSVHSFHLPMEVQGVLFGLLRTPYLTYLASSMLALLPSMMYMTIFGDNFDLSNKYFWIFVAVDLLVIAVGVIYSKRNIINGGKNKKADS